MVIFFWQVDINNWQVNIKIWQVNITIWQIMAEIWHHRFIINRENIKLRVQTARDLNISRLKISNIFLDLRNLLFSIFVRPDKITYPLSLTSLWWHISAITCQIIMSTSQIFMLTCQLFMLTCQIIMSTCRKISSQLVAKYLIFISC